MKVKGKCLADMGAHVLQCPVCCCEVWRRSIKKKIVVNINFVLIFTYGATLILTWFSPKLNQLELLVTVITQNLKMIVNDHSRPDGILLLFNIFYWGTLFTHNGRSCSAASRTHINTASPTTGPSTTFKSAGHDCGCCAGAYAFPVRHRRPRPPQRYLKNSGS